MDYLHSELDLARDAVVQVNLAGDAANVMLLDEPSFRNYEAGKPFEHQAGGHFTRSPVVLAAPHDGVWHLVVDLGGRAGNVTASVTVRSRTEDDEPEAQAPRRSAPEEPPPAAGI